MILGCRLGDALIFMQKTNKVQINGDNKNIMSRKV